MPVYRFRLEAQDGSGHYRSGAIAAESKEEARQTLEKREEGYALFRLTTEELANFESHERGEPVIPGLSEKEVRRKLALHRQAKPYKLVKLEKEG